MNYGRYFALDLKASRVEDGISVFNYIDLVETKISGENRITPEYPIFVTITPTSVKFILQFCIYRIEDNDAVYFSVSRTEGRSRISHMEEVLIELPLKDTKGPSLSSVVKHLYSSVFPISRKDQKEGAKKKVGYIEGLIARRYESSTEEDTYDILQKRDSDDVSYSSLFIWDMMSKGIYDLRDSQKNYTKVLRKLLLDFFFDMIHGDVFKNSVHYDDVYKALMEDFFCSSIIRKSEFYYQRELINRLATDKDLLFKSDSPDSPYYKKHPRESVFIYAGSFDLAEREWLESIQDPRSDKDFEYISSWYNIDTEENIREKPYLTLLRQAKDESQIIAGSWFVSPEEELRRVYMWHTYTRCNGETVDKDAYPVSCADDLAEIIKPHSDYTDRIAEVNNRKQRSSQWLFKRYAFADAFRLSFFRGFNLLLCMTLVIGIIFSRSLLVNCDNVVQFLLPVFLLIFSGLLVSLCKAENNAADTRYFSGATLRNIILRRKFIRWRNVIGAVCAVLLLVVGLQGSWLYAVAGLLIIILLPALLFSRRFSKFYNPLNRYIHLAFPRLIASITAAWFTIALSEDLFKAFFDSKWSGLMVGILLFVIFFFVMFEVDKAVPKVDFIKKICRTLELMLISFVISFVVGAVVINFTGDKMLERSGFLPEYYRNYVIHGNEYDEHWVIIDDVATESESLYEFASSQKLSELDSVRAQHVVAFFSSLKHEYEFDEKIHMAKEMLDSLNHVPDSLLTPAKNIDGLQSNFILRNENPKFFLKNLENLRFRYSDDSVAHFVTIDNDGNKFFILYDFLIQFAVVAMFIGIFIQMIFEEKNIPES